MKQRKIKRKAWVIMTIMMCALFTTYVLADAFLIPKSIIIVDDDRPIDTDPKPKEPMDPIISENGYQDDNIHITIETVKENGVVFYVVDIRLLDIKYLKSAFAKDTYGKNINEVTSSIAKRHEAILAINGDFYGFRDRGLIIRNGVFYRDFPRKAPDNRTLLIDEQGEFSFVIEGSVDGENLIDKGIVQSFSFGPVLVENGQPQPIETNFSKTVNPRTAIGMVEPLHYIIIVVDGRTSISVGMRLETLAKAFVERGVLMAYNLDGGGSSTLWFNGKVLNNPTTDGKWIGERKVSDILYFGY
jgi:hypothetical protein